MRWLALLLAVPLMAQAPALKPPKNEYPHWGKLYDVNIPKSCKHPLGVPTVGDVPPKKTCGVFVSFAGIITPGTPYWNLRYGAWDDTSGLKSQDTIYHLYLYVNKEQAWKGVTVYGLPGHKIMLEITHR